MNKKYLILVLFLLSLTSLSYGKDTVSSDSKLQNTYDLSDLRNPFLPQLPVKEKETIKKEVKKETQIDRIKKERTKVKKIKPIKKRVKKKTVVPKIDKAVQEVVSEEKKTLKEVLEPTAPEIKITGLIWNSEKPQAIIEGKVVNIGDALPYKSKKDVIKIIAIRKSEVDINFRDKIFTIKQ
ncbi:MAG: hypothetical protein P9X22_02725 [Candidatus Zapsychrus exili]|nr:hypothetical protein [Candidatus Zapsychrus exili]